MVRSTSHRALTSPDTPRRAMNPVVRSDIVVSHFLDSVGGYRHKERRDLLLNILDIDLDCLCFLLSVLGTSDSLDPTSPHNTWH